ncbi:MAG: (Fe-S)-binding protein [Candidatus Gastranaerophilales bacterium]|nr:(Fe-S)-binding protein [Candidatus Gastranaerophilales bacterium]
METIKEEVYKCSKCGLCQSVCPIYLATKNEMYLSRGRYIVLNNFFNNNKKISKKFINNLDICLNCNACKNFCPSNIDAKSIFTKLKNKYNYRYGIIPFSINYFFNLFIKSFKKKTPVVKRNKKISNYTKEKVLYFQGCVNRFVNSSDKNATLNILENLGYQVINVSNNCCGLPYLSDGNFKEFDRNSLKILKSIPPEIKYIVCSCDSCYKTLKNINTISDKLITLDELLSLNNYKIKTENNIVYHKPLSKKENSFINLPMINRKGSCSTMENFFLLKHPEFIEELIEKIFYKKEEIDNKTIITTCQLDKVGLKKGIKTINSNANLYSLAEYICLSDKDFQEK